MSRKYILAALLLTLGSTTSLFACLWDSDTLQMERLRFPGVLEIINGKFVRHSRAYYECCRVGPASLFAQAHHSSSRRHQS